MVQFIGVDALQIFDAAGAQFFQQSFCQLFVGLGNDFAGFFFNDVAGNNASDQEVFWNRHMGGTGLFHFTRVACSDTLVFGDHHIAGFVGDVKTRNFTAQTLGHKFHLSAAVHQLERVVDEEVGQNCFRRQANGFEQNGDRHFAATVDAEIQNIFGVEFVVQP